MESFLALFDTEDPKPKWDKYNNNNNDIDCSSMTKDEEIECLPPEPEQGNIEYKLKLVNPSCQRFEHLVTQMKWRLKEGHGEAIYQIGMSPS